jgi:hypothetical protein
MTDKFAKLYKEQRDRLREQFIAERTGDQTQYAHQAKLLKPLIETQEKTSKAIQDKIVTDHKELENALVPFTAELRKRNEQVDSLQNLPFHLQEIESSTPKKDPSILTFDLDKLLNDTDKENLQDMSLDLPSKVLEYNNFEDVLDNIKTLNRRYGQLTGKASTKDQKDQEVYRSYLTTLGKYKQMLLEQKPTLRYQVKKGEGSKLVRPKRGRGRPKIHQEPIWYKDLNELSVKLNEFIAAKQAGNTGLDNIINSILDVLLEKNCINKDEYDTLFKFIFPHSK